MKDRTSSVLIASYRRIEKLRKCLSALSCQSQLPSEVMVVWQEDDLETKATIEAISKTFPTTLLAIHCPIRNIVASENIALKRSTGEIVLLIDDDAIPPVNWVQRHLQFYDDDKIGAVGGSANNYWPNGNIFEKRAFEPIGVVRSYGRIIGNMHDQPDVWQIRDPIEIDHLVGYNFSFRRVCLENFDTCLKEYWQLFELDACLTIKRAGYKIVFDFQNTVEHHPTNPVFHPGRATWDLLKIKVHNGAFNRGYVLAKHKRGVSRLLTLGYLVLVGTTAAPGLLTFPVAVARNGRPLLEARLLMGSIVHGIMGWQMGSRNRNRSK